MYAKLFASIYQGTLRGNTNGLVVFTNLLAHADSSGWVDIHPRAIAEEVGLTIDQVNAAILELESPDPDSRSPDEGGRRIVRMDEHRSWGWIIVNHGKYRAIRSEEDRREQNRLAQQRFREKNKQSKQSKPRKPMSAQAEAEAEAEAEAYKSKSTSRAEARATRLPTDWQPTPEDIEFCRTKRPDLNPDIVADAFRDYWTSAAGAKGRKADWAATWRNWVRNEKAGNRKHPQAENFAAINYGESGSL